MTRSAREPADRRIVQQSDLAALRERHRNARIVLATGCFDLVHRGHIYFLNQAATQGDLLVVGINSDESVRTLKGVSRPIISAPDRGAVLAEFACVDYVFTYDETCAGASIRVLRPDVFAVGRESVGHYPDEIDAARETGAGIFEIDKVDSTSTTRMINTIKDRAAKPPVSVVYVNWNTKALLEASLASLVKYDGSSDLEIIVVDNDSSDGSIERLQQDWPNVRIVALDRNYGFGVGNNRGAEQARGDYLLLLNTDTIVLPTTVSEMVRALDAHSRVACVGARHLNPDGTLQRSMDSFPNIEADFFTLTELHRLPAVARMLARRHAWWSDHRTYRDVDWVNGACMLIRRQVFQDVGGFDPAIFIYGEELDLCRRIRDAGWGVAFTPEAEIIHIGGSAMDHIAVERLCLKYEGLLRFYDKHKSHASRVAIRALVLSTIFGRAVLLLFHDFFAKMLGLGKARRSVITQLAPDAPLADAFRAWRRIASAAFRIHR